MVRECIGDYALIENSEAQMCVRDMTTQTLADSYERLYEVSMEPTRPELTMGRIVEN